MERALLIIFIIFLVISMFKDSGDRKDRKRWPNLMATEDFLRDPKRATAKSKKNCKRLSQNEEKSKNRQEPSKTARYA